MESPLITHHKSPLITLLEWFTNHPFTKNPFFGSHFCVAAWHSGFLAFTIYGIWLHTRHDKAYTMYGIWLPLLRRGLAFGVLGVPLLDEAGLQGSRLP